MVWRRTHCARETRESGGGRGLLMLGDATETDLSAYFGKVQCVYIDPPFFTGEEFFLRQRVGEKGWATGSPSVLLKAYSDTFSSRESYLSFLRTLLDKARALLADEGALFLHLDTRMDAYARVLCDKVFGEKNFVNQIVWAYQSGGRSLKRFSRKHDLILFYQKSRALRFDLTQVPISRQENRSNHMRRTVDETGRPCRTIRSAGKLYVYYDDEPVYPGDVWTDLSHLQQKDPQRTGYDTQKPQALLSRILLPVTREDDLVADLCCGSGTTAVAAAALNRRFLMIDKGLSALSVSRKRLILENADFSLTADLPAGPARPALSIYTGIAYYDVCLSGFDAGVSLPIGVSGLDGLDQWSAGYLRDGVFVAYADAARSKRTPTLKQVLQIPLLKGTPAVLMTDILGNRTCLVADGA